MSAEALKEREEFDEALLEFSKCLLSYFDTIPIGRLHRLAFLAEYKYYLETDERYHSIQYENVMDGIFSDELQEAIDHLDDVQVRESREGTEKVKYLEIETAFESSMDNSDMSDAVEFVIKKFWDAPTEELNSVLDSIPHYKNTKLQHPVIFGE